MQMRNLLKLISAISLFSLTTSTVTACSPNLKDDNSGEDGKYQIKNPIVDIDKNPKLTAVIFNDIISENVITFNIPLGTNKNNGELSAILTKQLKEIFIKSNVILPSNFGVSFTDMVNQNQLDEGIDNWQSNYLTNKGNSYIILTLGLDKAVKVNAKYIINVISSTHQIKWSLDAYNNKQQENKIWISMHDIIEAITKYSPEYVFTRILWLGMFDADDKDGSHERQLERFEKQEIFNYLKINNLAALTAAILDNHNKESFIFNDLSLTLDKNLSSKTTNPKNNNEVIDYTLLKSETVINSVTVFLLKDIK